MEGEIELPLVQPPDHICDHAPLVDTYETFKQPQAKVVVHPLPVPPYLTLLNDELLFMGVLVENCATHCIGVLLLGKLDLPVD